MRYGATHRGFESLPLRHPSRDPLLSSSCRARRGTSGALYLQSAPAGLNSHPRSPSSNAAGLDGAEDRVPRSGDTRTASGPEGSSAKRGSPGAAARPGLSRPSRRARGRADRRWVHGTSPHCAPEEPRELDAAAPGALPTLALAALRRGRGPGRRRRDAAQRDPQRAARPTRTSSSGPAARARPRWRGSSPRRSTAQRRRRRAVRHVPELRRDPGGPRPRRRGARRRLEQPGRRHPGAAAPDLHRARGPADQGLHRRRGPADHPGLGRPPQDPRGAAAARPVHLLHHGQQPDPTRRGLTRAAFRLPARSRSR